MAQTSSYSYTERKRIRKNFGNRDSVVEMRYLDAAFCPERQVETIESSLPRPGQLLGDCAR